MNQACKKLPFEAIAVTQEMLDRYKRQDVRFYGGKIHTFFCRLNSEEERLRRANENPHTFEWMVRNNLFDCTAHLSPYDQKWFGKFQYHDRSLNKKWNLVRNSPYKGRAGNKAK